MTTKELFDKIFEQAKLSVPTLEYNYKDGDKICVIKPKQLNYSIPMLMDLFNLLVKFRDEKYAIDACTEKIINDMK